MKKNKFALLCDFDGTITKKDVGFHIYTYFGDERWEEINKSWRRGEISSKDCLIGEYSLMDASEDEVREYTLKMEIDPGFIEIVNTCKKNSIPLAVVSDGFDFYIDIILKKYGLFDIEVFCNNLRFNGRKVELSFPYYEQGCGICGNCKKLHVENFRNKYGKVIYIGDGLSDKFAAQFSDIVFAKGELAEYLINKEIKFIRFQSLSEVNKWLTNAISNEINCFNNPTDPCKEVKLVKKDNSDEKEPDQDKKEPIKKLEMKKTVCDMGDGRYIVYYEWS